eukprot:1439141-Amphidinium_carterae.1
MLMTILLCIHYIYFGSTISPLATVRHSLVTMVTSSTVDEPVNTPMAPGPLAADSDGDNDSVSTIARDIRDSLEIVMWNSLTSSNTCPLVRSQLQRAGIILQTNDEPRDNTTTVVRDQLIAMAMTPRIQLDNFLPPLATEDQNNYLWFTWLTETQYGQYVLHGTVQGHKDTRGDT